MQYGQTYPFSISIYNADFHLHESIPVANGKCIFSIVAETGEEAFRKEFSGLTIGVGSMVRIDENLTFLPLSASRYRFKVQYSDETGTSIEFMGKYYYFFKITDNVYVENWKDVYNYGDTIDLKVGLTGAGSYHLTVNCPREAYAAEKDIIYSNETGNVITESFVIPTTFSNAYSSPNNSEIAIEIKNNDTSCTSSLPGMCSVSKKIRYCREKIKMESWGKFDAVSAKAGEPIGFHLGLKALSGFNVPVSGMLTISSSGLDFTNSQAVTITPGSDSVVDYQLPISGATPAGYYPVYAWFEVEGRRPISQMYSIYIPAPGMKLAEPPASIAAGATLPMDFINDGGKDGTYSLELTLKDELGKIMLTHADTQAIAAGGTYHLDLAVPEGLKSGRYTLKQAVNETVSGKSFALQSGMTISGLTATLDAYTLKDKYFDSETVAGKAEMTSGGELADAILKARIYKPKRGGITVHKPHQYVDYSQEPVVNGASFGSRTYMVTYTGLVEYDRQTGKYSLILDFAAGSTWSPLYITPEGELWLCMTDGNDGFYVMKRDLSGTWTRLVVGDGSYMNAPSSFIEYDNAGQKEIWATTQAGIAVLRNGAWGFYTTSDGLSSNDIYELSKDGDGRIWVQTQSGVDLFNGTGFESVPLPFDQSGSYSYYNLIPSSTGEIWFESMNYDSSWAIQSSALWRYSQGSWSSWDLLAELPDVEAYGFREDDGALWFNGYNQGDGTSIVGKFAGTFTLYGSTETPEVAECMNVIPVPNSETVIFGSYPGFVEFNGDTWEKRLIEINGDENELWVNDAFLLAADSHGGAWIAGSTDIAHFQDGGSTNYSSEDAEHPWSVDSLAVGPDGSAYALNYVEGYDNAGESSILKVTSEGVSTIPFPGEFYSRYNRPVLGVDDGGRLWLGENRCPEGCMNGSIYYYDGQWHIISAEAWVNKIISDGTGGVWIAGGNVDWQSGKLIHVLADLTVQEFTSIETDLAYNSVEDIHRDNSGIIWILCKKRIEYAADLYPEVFNNYEAEAVQTLENGVFTLKAISASGQTTSGYPAGGIWGIAEAGAGNVVFAGKDTADGNTFHLYWLNGQEILTDENVFYTPYAYGYGSFYGNFPHVQHIVGSNDLIYAIGDVEYTGEEVVDGPEDIWVTHCLLEIGASLGSTVVWTNDYAVNSASGDSLNLDLLPGIPLSAGNYVLAGELTSALGQKLASSQHAFVVRGSAVAASIVRSGSSDVNVRSGNDVAIAMEVLNNTDEDKPALTVKVAKISPSGTETVLQETVVALNAGESHAGSLDLNESETGLWKLIIEVSEDGAVLDSSELLLEVSDPKINYEITFPEYASDEAFPVKIKLVNAGKIATSVHVSVTAAASLLNEGVSLLAGEERLLSFSDTIAADRAYDITFSGDLSASEQRTVKFGYVGALAVNVVPQHREGTVAIDYTVANSGGLAFADTIHFGLYLMGSEVALHAMDKTYNLYPGAEAIADALEFTLFPGAYRLQWTSMWSGSGSAEFTVIPSGVGQLVFAPAAKYPVGLTEYSYTLANTDTVAGSVDLLIEILPAAGGDAVLSLNRSHYLEPGAGNSDTFNCEFAQPGAFIVRISGAKVAGGMASHEVRVLNLDEVATSVAVQPTSNGIIPVQVQVVNAGYNDFAGTLVISAGGLSHEEALTVASESTLDQVYNFDANGLASGSQDVVAVIYDASGNVLSQNVLTVAVTNADIRVSEAPQDLTIAAGSFAVVSLKVKNFGNKRGEAEIAMTAFDNLNETRVLALEAGEELELGDLFVDVDADIPAGRYPFHYVLSGAGVSNGLAKGNFSFQVTGIALDVSAALDRSLYNQGETAVLTLNVSSAEPVTAPLEAVVNWNDFNERRPFTLDNGSSSLSFEIPLTEASDAKVFYGVYQQEGRGIYLNDIYLNFSGGVSVTLDQQVYAPGDSVHALFASGEAGNLTAECFGATQTAVVNGSASLVFAVPEDALGGSYGVAWTFTPADAALEASSGSKAFDVSGLVVKVAKAELEKGKYAPGETIRAMLSLESNRDVPLALRAWTVTPEAQWTYLGEQGITLSATQQTPAVLQYAFATAEAGTHRFVYGLYNGEQLVVSGAAAFDCGDAVLLGLAPDRLEYPLGSETVNVMADHFGSGSATLELYLDDVLVETRSVTLSGLGGTTISLAAAQVSGGRHDLRAVMTESGLTSTRRAWFTYGTQLPDLAVGLIGREASTLDYAFTIRVENAGKSASASTTLVFSDNDADVQSAVVNALAPGAYQDVPFSWSGSGKPGSHALRFEADREQTVKEFAEANNVLETTEEVPALFYGLSINPQTWSANSSVSIYSTLFNNQPSDLPLQLHMTLTHNETSLVVLDRSKTITLTPYVKTIETDVFSTVTHPAGDYTLAQTALGGGVERGEELPVYIAPTKAVSGSMSAVPSSIAAGVDAEITLTLALSNIGNVALENETLTLEVAATETQEVVRNDTLGVSMALGESKTMEHVLAVNLAAGAYTIFLKLEDDLIAQAEISAGEGLDKEKGVSSRPRLLFLNTVSLPYRSQKNFLKAALNGAGIEYHDTGNLIESYVQLQTNEHNINVVFGKLVSSHLIKELKERVHRGEGLICIVENPAENGLLEEVGGVKAHNLLPPLREKEITLLPGSLGGQGAATLMNKCKLGLELLAEGVETVAETKTGRKPVAALRSYGNGKALTLCLPLEFTSGAGFAQMMLNAVQLLNQDVFSPSDLARILPLELRIRNNTGSGKTFRVQEYIPQAAVAYGFAPSPLEGEGIRWDLQVADGEQRTIAYWLRLPDAVGTYDVRSEIREGEQKIDEALLTLEVGQKTADRAAAIAVEIAAAGDAAAKAALTPLQNIASRGDDVVSLWLNLKDAVQAADLVAASGTAEATTWRRQLQDVLMACARFFYDKIQDWSPLELDAFGTRIQD